MWIDTHVHLDAPEFKEDFTSVRFRAKNAGVGLCVIPAVAINTLNDARKMAHDFNDAYALGIHPLFVPDAGNNDLEILEDFIVRNLDDKRFVAIGEIGLDYYEPRLLEKENFEKQHLFFKVQLKLAKKYNLPVILHSRNSVDFVLKNLRDIKLPINNAGIAHAFVGSRQQADNFINMGFKLGFGGAMTYERATRLRGLCRDLPENALVLETDAPDIPPHWIYKTFEQRQNGENQGRNEPAEIVKIAGEIADLRGIGLDKLKDITFNNAINAIPKLRGLLD